MFVMDPSREVGNLCVAIVDDDPTVRTAMRRLLRAAGYAVVVFGCGRDFL